MRVYLDACCYNRPFDDLRQSRVRLESEAILSILENPNHQPLASEALDDELSRVTPESKHDKVNALYALCRERVMLTEEAKARAVDFMREGVKAYDALHLALAEHARADILLTTDDQFIKAAQRCSCSTRVANPVNWLMEV